MLAPPDGGSGALLSALCQWLWFCCLIYYFGLCRPFVVCGVQLFKCLLVC